MNNIFIQSIEIDELRHLKNIKIDIDENERKHLIITGKNGSGKSTVLEAIKSYLSAMETKRYKERIKAKSEVRKYRDLIKEYEENIINKDEKRLKINNLKTTMNAYQNYIDNYGKGVEVSISNSVNVEEQYINGKLVLSYFSAKRNSDVIIPKGVEKVNLSYNYKIDSKPANQFLKYLVDLKTQQSFARNEGEDEEADKIGEWFNSFENSLKNLMDDNSIKLKFDYKNYNFSIIEKEKEPYGFNELSDGYSAVLDIVMDLIMRMEKKASRAYDLQGIVLIDEVETHLHIGLQKKIMPFLNNLFPNIQFIVTTHSPFVLNSIENAVIYDLEKQIKVEDLTAYSYEGIVESYFDIDQYSKQIKDRVNHYSYLVNKEDKTEEEIDEMQTLRKYLKNIPQDLSPELYAKFLEIEINRRALK